MSKERVRRMEDSHTKVDNANVTVRVIIVVEDVLGSVKWVKGGGVREGKANVNLQSLDDSMVVKAVDGVENG